MIDRLPNKFLASLFCALPFVTFSRLLVADDPASVERQRMVADQIERRGVRNPDVLRVMRTTPRHLFVPADDSIHGV